MVVAESTRARAPAMARNAVTLRRGPGSVMYLSSTGRLPAYPCNLTERLDYWAEAAPNRVFLADRGPDGAWRRLTFADARRIARSLAQFLLDLDLSVERPVVALSGNDIELGLVTLAAMYAGVPIAPVSPAYSLVSKDFAKLRYLFGLVTPGLVYVSDAEPFAPALDAVMTPHIPLVVRDVPPAGFDAVAYAAAAATEPTDTVDRARAAAGPDTIAKFLFTSGTTGKPKAVINTQRMLCANQAMIASVWRFFTEAPPVLVDWLPWNHTAGGNHNFGIALYNGGSLYIDDGNPTPSGITKSVRNLREISPTFYSNVPRGYEALVSHLEGDAGLRHAFFRDLQVMQYAGAGLSQHVWDTLDRLSREITGRPMLMVTGYGSTETAPFAFATTERADEAGHVGLPAPGLEVKLVPSDGKLELRLKGPNVTPGYWRQPEQTAASFDEEGFYRIGDALAFADTDDVSKGFLFDGRIAEDFKLSTGTWVNCAAVRARLITEAGAIIREVVLAGADRPYIGALVFPDPAACRRLVVGFPPDARDPEILAHPAVRAAFQSGLSAAAGQSTGSSTYVARAIVLDTPPSLDANEVTDKGSINHRAVLAARAGLVEDLYSEPPPGHVLVA